MQTIVVDVESTGLRPWDYAVEVAWYNLATHERGLFIPPHDVEMTLRIAQPEALATNGYRERIVGARQDDGAEGKRLYSAVQGNLLMGSNVRADAGWLFYMFVTAYGIESDQEPWHYHLQELSSYAKPILGMGLDDKPPSLRKLCELLGVQEEGVHTAESGVMTTVQVIQKLEAMR